jgi:hypothetical protein
MPDLPTPKRLPYPHARNDCQACRERDADLRMLPDPDCTDRYQPARQHEIVLCAGCFGTQLAYQAVHNSGPHFDQPTTVTVALVDGQQIAALTAAGPAPYPPATYWPAAARLAYPHRHNDCHSCQERDADLVLVDLEPRPSRRTAGSAPRTSPGSPSTPTTRTRSPTPSAPRPPAPPGGGTCCAARPARPTSTRPSPRSP